MNRPNAPTQGLCVFVLCFSRSFHPDQIAPGDRLQEVSTFLLLHLQTSSRHPPQPLFIPLHQVISRGVISPGPFSDSFLSSGTFHATPYTSVSRLSIGTFATRQTSQASTDLPSTRTRSHLPSSCLFAAELRPRILQGIGNFPSRPGSGKAKGLTTGPL